MDHNPKDPSCLQGITPHNSTSGEVTERPIVPVSKTGVGESLPRVQIPPSPFFLSIKPLVFQAFPKVPLGALGIAICWQDGKEEE